MKKGNYLSKVDLKELEKFKDPTVTEIIELSKNLNIDLEILARYFLEKVESEINK